ncbi:MAG: WD40 repeat domain-containing serine/threonine-protein kinase [Coleofasciculus sp. B1-GNL1-01]|uniref:protein kinase domain-containing protein n=1 Tax=Coleofasciculus sp. B1-GNL1-01 TaxID=3068484 RepID=UPI0032F52B38
MSYCLNPNCDRPQNPDGMRFCRRCGSKLLLRERYRSLGLIGQGGFGKTFLAVDEDKPSKPQCVIKQFFPLYQGTSDVQKATELFEREAVRLDELGKHPQIPELLAHFTQDNRQYLVQEFIDGQNLAQILAKEGVFNEQQIREMLRDLLSILEFIHSRSVIHRDIKPENIIRRRHIYIGETEENAEGVIKGNLVLVDFGAAKHAIGTTKTGTTVGTPDYIAPEQAKGKAIFASDLYSLGVSCIHLLTQTSPEQLFDTGEDTWVWRRYLKTNLISDELGSILDKLLKRATNHRYQSVAEVLRDLNQLPSISLAQHSTPSLSPQSISLSGFQGKGGQSAIASTPANPLILQPPSHPPLTNWQVMQTLDGHWGSVEAVAISPDGLILASGSADTTAMLWQLPEGQEYHTLNGHLERVCAVAFTPDSQYLATGSYDQTIKLWQVENGQLILTLTGHKKWISSLAISPDGEILASGSNDGTIKLWHIPQTEELQTLTGHTSYINDVAISPDGESIASVSGDGTVKVWQISTGEEQDSFGDSQLRFGFFYSVAFSPDGQLLATGKSDGTITLWQLETRRELGTLRGHTQRVRTLAFSPNGYTLASGSMDKTIKIWQLYDRQTIATLNGHSWEVYAVAFSPDGETLVSGSMDKTIKVWRCEKGS